MQKTPHSVSIWCPVSEHGMEWCESLQAVFGLKCYETSARNFDEKSKRNVENALSSNDQS